MKKLLIATLILFVVVLSGCEFVGYKISSQAYSDEMNLCVDKVNEKNEVDKIKSHISFSYRILEVKEFENLDDAESYRKKYSTFNLANPVCENQQFAKIIAVMYERRYSSLVEPLTGMQIEKETIITLCNEKGEFLKRGYSWTCK